ncbi:MAG: GNAT family N-acetyltransferase [Kangiellaceae bacterium]|jgi:tRNA(Met) cytidine acetyltransferase|nr:GNAT family N-acetyltransferase [Kangiellaceae bacterium]
MSSSRSWQQQFSSITDQLALYEARLPLFVHVAVADADPQQVLSEQLAELSILNRSFNASECILISDVQVDSYHSVDRQGYRKLLGREFSLVIVDALSGLSASLLSAVAGLVKAGGILLVIAPEQQQWLTSWDNEWYRLFGIEQSERANFGSSRFISRLLKHRDGCAVYQQGELTLPDWFERLGATYQQVAATKQHTPSEVSNDNGWRDYSEQQQLVQSVTRVFAGHAKRPLLISARRGRGKSSALGRGIADWFNQGFNNDSQIKQKVIAITAPTKQQVAEVFYWFSQFVDKELIDNLQFLPPDQLLESMHSNDNNKPPYSGVVVDEAASIPSFMLWAIAKRHNRLIFATTIEGYEGTGRGFAVKFKPRLLQLMPKAVEFSLHQPIRWADKDPLESWLDQCLLLQPQQDSSALSQGQSHEPFQDEPFQDNEIIDRKVIQWHWFTPTEAPAEADLQALFTLLLEAHYQTTPDDLRALLEHPYRWLLLAKHRQRVVGVSFVVAEPGLTEEMASDVSLGKRRIRGRLLPQTLAYYLNQPTDAQVDGARIQRIAVDSRYRRAGIGAAMLQEVTEYFGSDRPELNQRPYDCRYLSSSFAAAAELVPFWRSSGFLPIRLGLSKETVSGLHSVVMMKALSDEIVPELYYEKFLQRTRQLLPYAFVDLEPALIVQLWRSNNGEQLEVGSQGGTAGLVSLIAGNSHWQDAIIELNELIEISLANYDNRVSGDVATAQQDLIALVWQLGRLDLFVSYLNYTDSQNSLSNTRQSVDGRKSAERYIVWCVERLIDFFISE